MLKLSIENPFLFDFIKYETMRAEIDYHTSSSTAWVLWENKVKMPDLKKIGLLNGYMSECVNQMQIKKGVQKKEGQLQPCFEESYWNLDVDHIYIGSRLSNDNLLSLVGMVETKNLDLVLPGMSIVSTTEEDALKIFRKEHKSRSALVNVLFRIDLSI